VFTGSKGVKLFSAGGSEADVLSPTVIDRCARGEKFRDGERIA
jgi:hypothetical protein